jgi:hypothetical protein
MRAVGFILKGEMLKYKKLLQHVRVCEGISATKCFINEISYTIFYTLHLLSHLLIIFKFGEFCRGWQQMSYRLDDSKDTSNVTINVYNNYCIFHGNNFN